MDPFEDLDEEGRRVRLSGWLIAGSFVILAELFLYSI